MTREEAIERLERMLYETQVVCDSNTATEPIRRALKKDAETYTMAIEALRQERPKGRWELLNDDWNVYRCTACGEEWTLEAGEPKENNMNYCPNCGADMRGEKNV